MSSFFNKLKPGVAAANAANNVSPNRKKDENAPELTPLEKMLQNAGPLPDDGTDRFFGLENFGNTCYCNSIVQALFYSETFRENVIRYPPFLSTDTPDGKPRKVNVQIRPPISAIAPNAVPTGPAAAAAANRKPPPGQQVKTRPPMGPGQPPNGPTPVRPEDKPDSPEYKKKQAMIKGPVLELAQENASAYGMEECTFTGLKDIFMALMESGTRTGVLSPLRFLEIFRNENESFRNSMHQDAHEFYGLVLNDVIRTVEANAQRLQDREDARRKEALAQSMQAALANGSGDVAKTPNDVQLLASSPDGTRTPGTGWVHDIFEGVLTSETRCLTCETASSREETFLDLSIDLDEHSSVTSCLRKFSAEEMLCERNKFHCDHCGGLQEAEKRMKIKRLPKVLALHLKRFKYAEDYTKLEKLFHRVVYPYQLRMFNTTDGTQEPDRMYELYAVVVHIGGNAYHGHYVAVIKTKERGWLLFDDEMVEPVDKDYVRNFFGDKPGTACAYVLFYQETTLEKVQAEQEAEGLEEFKLATALQDEGGDLAISTTETAANHANGGANGGISLLSRLAAQPAVAQVEDHEDLANLNHARTAPGAVMTPVSSVPPVPLLSSSYGASTMTGLHQGYPFTSADKATDKHTNAKAEAARLKEEKEREKREAKAAEKARKAQEKETAKEVERLRKERELQRKSEAEELRKAIAASKQTAVEEREARKQSLDGGTSTSASTMTATTTATKSPGFLNRSSRGSKSMSRRSFAFLGKDKDRERPDLPTTYEHQPTTNGTTANGSSNSASTAAGATGIPALPEVVDKPDKHVHKDHRFSFSMGRKKSGSFMP